MSRCLYSQEEALFLNPDLLGGKAANLAWLSREGLPMPRWWVVTTDVFTQLLRDNGLSEMVAEALAGIGPDTEPAAIEPIAVRIQQQVLKARLSGELLQAIGELVKGREEQFFAVRSSVLGEDAQGASFAGQMDSYLFQRGRADIGASLLQVAASAFNARALQYRIAKGIALDDIRAAVIIQEMIEGEVSGVMFTAHPLNGSRRHALISAAWGVGEGIVAGICNTDEFTVSLFDNTIERQLADKDQAVVFDRDAGRGTKEIHLDGEQRHIACLSDTHILSLRDIGLKIATLQHFPQDIEWAIRQDQVYILQTRPVTRLPEPKEPVGRRIVFDNSNIQESYCGVTTPLTFSFANRAYATVYEQTMRVLGVSDKGIAAHRDMLDNMLGLVHGRVYYNINNWYRGLLLLPAFKTNKADMERMMGLTDPVDLVQDREFSFGEKLLRLPQVLRALFNLLRGFRQMGQRVTEFRALFENAYRSIDRDHLHTRTPGELIDEARRLDRELLQRWTSPIINDFYVMMMNGKVHRTLVEAGFTEPAVLQNNLLSGEDGIESTEPTKMLLRMCAYIRTQPTLRTLVETGDNHSLLARIQVHDANFHTQCLDYIERYGDRTIGELKLESVTLRQDTAFLFAVLKNYLTRDDLTPETLASKEAQFRDSAEEEAFTAIRTKLGNRALTIFKKNLDKLRDAIRNRENMRLARTRVFGLYRDLFLEIGSQFAFSGLLDDKRDIFYLSVDELYAMQDGRAVQLSLKAMVAGRKAEFAEYQKADLPHHFWTHGMVYYQNSYRYPFEVEAEPTGNELKGTGCYPGIVEEKIRLIFSPDDELSLNGQILCTVRTDPGWAPLFPTAGGILVERGSTLSHSAVVARELGIPAIVGIPGITQRLRDGEKVRMDGAKGTIVRLESSDQ
ncbi:MAG: phosphoenolpyruvate synthase [Fluviicoccus sp.]|uniref:phosphoenolpyruvate synthase n=1 Tax=Fluviicoccus sp. TaxID=2003552 RepID=UPI00272586D7|nr:phosphoenolpyruvate synthase [Fluviicoccus sp.]MDO8329062.1 phosphoenolpyruvate synthase [Fluviicoccus sp.]